MQKMRKQITSLVVGSDDVLHHYSYLSRSTESYVTDKPASCQCSKSMSVVYIYSRINVCVCVNCSQKCTTQILLVNYCYHDVSRCSFGLIDSQKLIGFLFSCNCQSFSKRNFENQWNSGSSKLLPVHLMVGDFIVGKRLKKVWDDVCTSGILTNEKTTCLGIPTLFTGSMQAIVRISSRCILWNDGDIAAV